jgi:hypothetical protein
MGLPMVTLSGEAFASRMAGRLLQAIGATHGITESIEAYIETAVALATQPGLFARYRSLFNATNWAATIGDIGTFTYHYEESLIQIELALRTRTGEPLYDPAEQTVGDQISGEDVPGDQIFAEAAAA